MNNYELTTTKREEKGVSNTGLNLQEIYLKYYNDLYYYGLKISSSEEVARDCIQDMFMQFWSNTGSLTGVRSVRAYLLKCYRRRIIEQLTSEKIYIQRAEQEERLEFFGIVESHEKDIIERDRHSNLIKRLLHAKKDLTLRQQEILYLKFNLGYSYDAICEIMGIKYQSVRNLLSESIKFLRKNIESETFRD